MRTLSYRPEVEDDLVAAVAEDQPIPLPDGAIEEAARRRDELHADPKLGLSHEEVWRRIDDTRHAIGH